VTVAARDAAIAIVERLTGDKVSATTPPRR
jgi:hypothetical protein